MDERIYWLGFSVFPGIGPKRFSELLTSFGSAKDIWHAPVNKLQIGGLGEILSKRFVAFRDSFSLEKYNENLEKKKVRYFTFHDKGYPESLKQILNPPFVLYVRGEFDFNAEENKQTIGIVGTRRITSYGKEVTQMFTRDLVSAGFVVVSGLAMGVDAMAHTTTIENGGKTVAVLGSGVDICHPSINERLYNSIIEGHGAVISEYPPGQAPSKGSFPSRNRIIAGLSQAVLLTEGAEDSGALYTASDAFAVGRKVYAVPGPITSSLSKGPFKLLQKGAMLVTSSGDILKDLNIKHKQNDKLQKVVRGDTEEEQKIIDLLQAESMKFDEIVKKSGISSINLGTLLSLMEVKGYIQSYDSGTYTLVT